MQFYLDGKQNNFYSFFFTQEIISQNLNKKKLLKSHNYLKGKNLKDISYNQYFATQSVFKKKNIPFRTFLIEKRDEKSLGTLFTYFIL